MDEWSSFLKYLSYASTELSKSKDNSFLSRDEKRGIPTTKLI
jgi:hypothetical protein